MPRGVPFVLSNDRRPYENPEKELKTYQIKQLLEIFRKGEYEPVPWSYTVIMTHEWQKYMNYLWGGMILVGVIYGTITGNLKAVTEAAIDSSKEAVNLCVVMAGVTALWVGMMRIAENTGLLDAMVKKMRPVMKFLFPAIPQDHPANSHMAMNIVANILGLGWAATPAGLKGMEALADLEDERRKGEIAGIIQKQGTASNEMCTFLILNISSLQLIPVNIIAYRSQYGSVNPAAIVGPGIVATAVSTAVAVVFCKVMDRR